MTLFNITNALMAWTSTAIIVTVLLGHAERLSLWQRLGLAMMGAGFLMSTPPLFFEHTPFDIWSFSVTRIGATVYLIGMYGPHLARRLFPTPGG